MNFLTNPEIDKDILIEIPPDLEGIPNLQTQSNIIEFAKEYIPDQRYRIKLDDLVTEEIRKTLYLTTDEHLPVNGLNFSVEEFIGRLSKYESITKDLRSIMILLSYYGSDENRPIIRKIIARVADQEMRDGGVVWLYLRRYPTLLLFLLWRYCCNSVRELSESRYAPNNSYWDTT
jgi:hypothetical protein